MATTQHREFLFELYLDAALQCRKISMNRIQYGINFITVFRLTEFLNYFEIPSSNAST